MCRFKRCWANYRGAGDVILRLSQVPAMDYNWVVTTFNLNINHLSHHTGDGVQVRAGAIRSPVVHMKLNYLLVCFGHNTQN